MSEGTEDLFQRATRAKLRFESPRGLLSVEDLWDLPLSSTVATKPNLDDIARGLHKKLTSGTEISFVSPTGKSPAVERDQLAMDVVKHVISVRVAENEAASQARAKAERKKQILEIIADKEVDALRNKDPEELRRLLNEL